MTDRQIDNAISLPSHEVFCALLNCKHEMINMAQKKRSTLPKFARGYCSTDNSCKHTSDTSQITVVYKGTIGA